MLDLLDPKAFKVMLDLLDLREPQVLQARPVLQGILVRQAQLDLRVLLAKPGRPDPLAPLARASQFRMKAQH